MHVFVSPYLVSVTQTMHCAVGRSRGLKFALHIFFFSIFVLIFALR